VTESALQNVHIVGNLEGDYSGFNSTQAICMISDWRGDDL